LQKFQTGFYFREIEKINIKIKKSRLSDTIKSITFVAAAPTRKKIHLLQAHRIKQVLPPTSWMLHIRQYYNNSFCNIYARQLVVGWSGMTY
jgi:hypothetical protein